MGEDRGEPDTGAAPVATTVTRSSRDRDDTRHRLERWLAARLDEGAAPEISALTGTDANGMSSETLLIDAEWSVDGARRPQRLVARVAPSADDVPVFPRYALGEQFAVIGAVAERTGAPVPPLWWHEPDESVVGGEFFVMGRVDGSVPPDVMPYNFGDSWLFRADAAQQRRVQDSTVAAIAEIHSVEEPAAAFPFLVDGADDRRPADAADLPAGSLGAHMARTRHWYEWMTADAERSPVLDRAFAEIYARTPVRHAGDDVLTWGDSRIGNVMYRDFAPVAVFDWEMVAIGPPELDVAWLAYAHRMFESLAAFFGLPGMPGFLRLDDVVAEYESITGRRLGDLPWFTAYSALQFGVVFLRTGQRALHFGEAEAPDEIDELIRNKDDLERALDELAAWSPEEDK